MKIAYVTYRKQARYTAGTTYDEDASLLSYLLDKGLDIESVIWNDAGVNWTQYSTAVLKSPWDYHEVYGEFTTWLADMDQRGIPLLNPYDIITWNGDKHYLKDIADAGLSIVPSLFIEQNTLPLLQPFFAGLQSEKLVVKPCVSASAKHTMVVTAGNRQEIEQQLTDLLKDDSFIVQPFVNEIVNGEISLIFLGGLYSHSVLKLPKAGDFRVQHFHGGTVQAYEPSGKLLELATEYVRQFAKDCLYARVDGVLINGEFQLMELELIEPYLFLGFHPLGYQRYYEALVRCMGDLQL